MCHTIARPVADVNLGRPGTNRTLSTKSGICCHCQCHWHVGVSSLWHACHWYVLHSQATCWSASECLGLGLPHTHRHKFQCLFEDVCLALSQNQDAWLRFFSPCWTLGYYCMRPTTMGLCRLCLHCLPAFGLFSVKVRSLPACCASIDDTHTSSNVFPVLR
jgi:hypothetical protein